MEITVFYIKWLTGVFALYLFGRYSLKILHEIMLMGTYPPELLKNYFISITHHIDNLSQKTKLGHRFILLILLIKYTFTRKPNKDTILLLTNHEDHSRWRNPEK